MIACIISCPFINQCPALLTVELAFKYPLDGKRNTKPYLICIPYVEYLIFILLYPSSRLQFVAIEQFRFEWIFFKISKKKTTTQKQNNLFPYSVDEKITNHVLSEWCIYLGRWKNYIQINSSELSSKTKRLIRPLIEVILKERLAIN